jgi:hypothetical protein
MAVEHKSLTRARLGRLVVLGKVIESMPASLINLLVI